MIRSLAVLVFSRATGALAHGDGAVLCRPGTTGAWAGKSSCCYTGPDSKGNRFCHRPGCKRGGTASCPTPANVKSCGRRVNLQPAGAAIPWCAPAR